jgi:hypothetical protein
MAITYPPFFTWAGFAAKLCRMPRHVEVERLLAADILGSGTVIRGNR